jgi:hypothetical protein
LRASREKLAVIILLGFSFTLFAYYSLATPLFEASDELWHYPLVQHLATTASLPVQQSGQSDEIAPWRQEGSQPPLYYSIAALLTSPIDASNWRDIRRLNPHADMGRPTEDGNSNAVLHTTAEDFPWTRAALAVRLARLVSIIFSTLTVLFAYLFASELFPRTNKSASSAAWLRLGTMLFTACVPMFAFISGSVNNDNAAAMFATLGLWLALRLARRGDLSPRTATICGVVTSAAALSKSSTLGLLGMFCLATVFAAIRQFMNNPSARYRPTILAVARFVAILTIVTILLAGWWFARNQMLYGDPLGWNAFLDSVGRRVPPASLQQLWTEREGFVWAFWGVFGTLNVIMPPIIYDLLNGMVIAAVLGIFFGILRSLAITKHQNAIGTNPTSHIQWVERINKYAPAILSATWLIVVFVAFLRWTSLTPASQGRLLFPALAVISAAIVYGLSRWHRYVLIAGSVGVFSLVVCVPFGVITPAYARPPNMALVNPQHLLGASYNNALTLLGYDEPPSMVSTGESATIVLYWRATGTLSRNYSVFVHLINDDDVIVAQRDMYPGQGSIATSEMSAGYAWSDHYTLRLSSLTPAQQRLRWAVGVYDLTTGERLIPTNVDSTDQGIVFGATEVTRSQGVTRPLINFENGIALKSYETSDGRLKPGQQLTATLVWNVSVPISKDYAVSLQLLDEHANKIAQHDGTPQDGNAPTSSWKRGSDITDVHVLSLAPDAKPGVYRLILVLYTQADFTRLGAYDERNQFLGTEVELTKYRVR